MSWPGPTPTPDPGPQQFTPDQGSSTPSPPDVPHDEYQPPFQEFDPPVGPPLVWLACAAALVLASFTAFFIAPGATVGVVGWVLGGPLAIGAMAFFITADGKRRATGNYAPTDLALWGRRVIICAALLAVCLNAWIIAHDVARGIWR